MKTSNSKPSPRDKAPFHKNHPHIPRRNKSTQTNTHIPQLPFWALVSFGAYLLFKLGWGVFTFNDVPEAHKELMAEIELARADLRTKGVEVD